MTPQSFPARSAAIDANFIYAARPLRNRRECLSGWPSPAPCSAASSAPAIAGPLSQRIGRRGGLLVAAVLFLVSAIGSAYPELGFGPIGGMGPDAL